jgi:hypothetical protein
LRIRHMVSNPIERRKNLRWVVFMREIIQELHSIVISQNKKGRNSFALSKSYLIFKLHRG